MEGWIKLHRKMSESHLWLCEQFTRGQAWVDMLMLANYEDSYFFIRGNKIDVKRGQIAWSEDKLAKRWGWSRTKLRSFINMLEKELQIELQKSNVIQIITVVNYDLYQEKEPQTGQQKDRRKTTERPQKDTSKEREEDIKKDKNIILPYQSELFKSTWEVLIKQKKWKGKGEDALRTSLEKLAAHPEHIAIEMMKNSIAGGWQGVFEIRGGAQTEKQSTLEKNMIALQGAKEILRNGTFADTIQGQGTIE